MNRHRMSVYAALLFLTVCTGSCSNLSFNPKLADDLSSDTTGTVRFIAEGAEDEDVSYRLALGKTYTTLPVPVRSGYTFYGWYSEQDGNGIQYTRITVTGSTLTLYAYWKITETIAIEAQAPSGTVILTTDVSSAAAGSTVTMAVTENSTSLFGTAGRITSATLTLYQGGAATAYTSTDTTGTAAPAITLPSWLPADTYQLYLSACIDGLWYSGYISFTVTE